MTRDFQRLARRPFDVLIVGGGIHGLFAAFEAARRGWRTALVEQNDFGSGLSFNHQRTVHGGLRALQTGNVFKARHQIVERRQWARIAPAQLRLLPFIVGTYRGSKRSRGRLRAGLALYDAVAAGRNHDVPASLHLPASEILSIDETMARFPGVDTRGLTGGAMWFDYQAIRPDRLNWLVALAAIRAGATLFNHTEAVAGLRENGRVTGARVRDALLGSEYDVVSRMTLLAAGAGLPTLFDRFSVDDEPPAYLAAANLLVDRAPLPVAIAAPGASGRMLTAVPWAGATLVGTFQSLGIGTPGSPFPLDVDAMVAEANLAFPAFALTRGDVRLVHRGWTPATSAADVDLLGEPEIISHGLRGRPGLVSLVGVKFTTARSAALSALARVAREGGLAPGLDLPGEVPLPYGSDATAPDLASAGARAGVPPETVDHLTRWYGDEARDVIELVSTRGLGARLDPELPVIEAEIAYAALASQAVRLGDAVLRRTALGAARRPALGALERAAAIMEQFANWPAGQGPTELAAVEERFRI